MNRRTFLVAAAALLAAPAARARPVPALRTGDLVFQTSRSSQSVAIQAATDSPYSHVGIIELAGGRTWVVEAVQPVSRTRWETWRARGEGARVLARRVRGLDESRAAAVLAEAKKLLGRPYDAAFAWGDAEVYCSELVRLAFERGAAIELGRMQRLGDLRLDGLGDALARRFGPRLPLSRTLVTPASIAGDERLDTVFSTY